LRELSRPGLARGIRIGHVIALLGGALLLLSSLTTTLDEDRQAVRAQPTFANIQAAAARHPLDFYNYAVAADLLERTNDPRAIRLLNHALLLHPTHPDLHRKAARMLYRDGFKSQATIEYAAALASTTEPSKLIAEITSKFSAEQAATALPLDYPQLEALVRTLVEVGHSDVAALWLERSLAQQPKSSRACEQLFLLAQRGDLRAAQVAGNRCMEMLPDYQTRLALAKLLADKRAFNEILTLLKDVDTWQGRVDDKINGWLTLCDAHRSLGHNDDAKRCLRRLDASPDMRPERRNEILTRIEAINSGATGSGSASP
jgi:tetratricopeptide (TPR) repeat protein